MLGGRARGGLGGLGQAGWAGAGQLPAKGGEPASGGGEESVVDSFRVIVRHATRSGRGGWRWLRRMCTTSVVKQVGSSSGAGTMSTSIPL